MAADPAMAQMETPAPYPLAPDPRECVIEPASIQTIEAILGTPAS
jgi:hypothetical protein